MWLPRLDAEVDNFRAALDWSLRHGDPSLGLRLSGLLGKFWEHANRKTEGLEWIEATLEAAGSNAPARDRACARRAQVWLLINQGAAYDLRGLLDEARSKAIGALALSREAAEPAGIVDALLALANLDTAQSQPQRHRRALADEALTCAREAGDERLVALALMEQASAIPLEADTGELDQAVTALRQLGGMRPLIALYNTTAYNAIKGRHPEAAGPFLAEAVPLADELGDPHFSALTWGNVGLEAALRRRFGPGAGRVRRAAAAVSGARPLSTSPARASADWRQSQLDGAIRSALHGFSVQRARSAGSAMPT